MALPFNGYITFSQPGISFNGFGDYWQTRPEATDAWTKRTAGSDSWTKRSESSDDWTTRT